MISLKKYLTDDSKYFVIENELENHFLTEFILRESFKTSYFRICEKYGSYIGQKELMFDIAKEIYKSYENQEGLNTFELEGNDLNDYSNIFFEKLVILITDNGDTSYIANKSNFNKTNRLLDQVIIKISNDFCLDFSELCSALMHEMLHAFNHYQSIIKGSKFNLYDLTKKNSSYYKTLTINSKESEHVQNCRTILNVIRQWEQNSYLNELSIELDSKEFDFSQYQNINDAYKKALDIFMSTTTWKQYSGWWNYLTDLYNDSIDNQQIFADEYNRINNTKLSFNKIYKKLDGLFNKIFKKMETKVPKIFYDYYINSLMMDECLCSRNQDKRDLEFYNWKSGR